MNLEVKRIRNKLAAAGLGAAALALGAAAPAAVAHPMHGGGMEMHEHGWHGHEGHHDYLLKPHNAAMYFILLGHELGLDQNQMQQLIKMRDQYIQNNAVAKEQVKADQMDLKWLLMSNIAAQDFDKNAINGKLEDIKKLKTQLWTAYVDQLQSINQLLTAEQKKRLMDMMAERAHGGPHGKPPHGRPGMGGPGMGSGMEMHDGDMGNMNGNNGGDNGDQNGTDSGD